jgi:hypothetical protein
MKLKNIYTGQFDVTTKAHHFSCGQMTCGNCPFFVGSTSGLQKELIAHFLAFSLLIYFKGGGQNSGAQNGKY